MTGHQFCAEELERKESRIRALEAALRESRWLLSAAVPNQRLLGNGASWQEWKNRWALWCAENTTLETKGEQT